MRVSEGGELLVDHQECAILEGLFGLHLFDTISILSLPDRI
jgi:hypothetical protein